MLEIVICDDEIKLANGVKKLAEKYIHDRKIDATFYVYQNPKDILGNINNFNIVFLDIEMGEYNGIEIAKNIKKVARDTLIIFMTSYDQYSIKAYKAHAFDYIMKPINYEKIRDTLDDLFTLNHKLLDKELSVKFRTKQFEVNVKVNDILYFELDFRQIYYITLNSRVRIIDDFKKIKTIFQEYDFYSPHKSFMVNLDKIDTFKGYEIYMINGDCIPLSQKKSPEFRKNYRDFINQCDF